VRYTAATACVLQHTVGTMHIRLNLPTPQLANLGKNPIFVNNKRETPKLQRWLKQSPASKNKK